MGRALVFDAALRGIGPGGDVRAVELPTTMLMMMMMMVTMMTVMMMIIR